jgi:hypothetical protein
MPQGWSNGVAKAGHVDASARVTDTTQVMFVATVRQHPQSQSVRSSALGTMRPVVSGIGIGISISICHEMPGR